MHSIFTRAEFVTTLVDMLKLNEVTTAPKLEDVAADAVYADPSLKLNLLDSFRATVLFPWAVFFFFYLYDSM